MSYAMRQIALAKGAHRFIFRYGQGQEDAVLEAFRGLAGNPDSGFDWFDAAVLCFRIARRLERQTQRAAKVPTVAKKAG